MRFALIDDLRREAEPGLSGTCPGCAADLVAKCGKTRVWHWAHRGNRSCDPWWEPETEWHRNWKSHFPIEQQEVRQQAESGEWHIADVKTRHGMVLEFQHSHLDPEERAAREDFYTDMIWVVDGCRLKRTAGYIFGQIAAAQRWRMDEVYTIPGEPMGFPDGWTQCKHPVIFDLQASDLSGWGQRPDLLWCLLPGRAHGHAVVISIKPDEFLNALNYRQYPISTKSYMSLMTNSLKKIEERERMQLSGHRSIF